MALTQYTSYNDIRAAVGVSTDELEDGTLALQLYENTLLLDLADISPDLKQDYLDAADDPSSVNLAFRSAVQIFATYSVARALIPALPLMVPQGITDGKAGISRFSGNPFVTTAQTLRESFDRFRKALADAYTDYSNGSATDAEDITYLIVASPDTDPVTGA